MSVALATRVYGSEVLVALIRYYRKHPGLQKDAAEALGLPAQVVSSNTRILVAAGIVVGDPPPAGQRPGKWVIDEARALELADALVTYALKD